MIAIAYHAILSYLLLDLRSIENNDTSELGVNNESRVTSPALHVEPVSSQGENDSLLYLPFFLIYF